MTDLAVLDAATASFVDACRSVRADQLTADTPCSEWDVGQLIDHVTGGNRFTVAILDGLSGGEALASARASFDGTHDPVAAGIQSSMAQQAAFNDGGALHRRCSHVAGELSGLQVLRLRLHDLIVHTWDLRQAVHPPARIPAALWRWATHELADPRSLTAGHFATGFEGVPGSAEELLAAFGRRPAG